MDYEELAWMAACLRLPVLSREEGQVLAQICTYFRRVRASTEIEINGLEWREVAVLRDGWACSYKVSSSGTRQIIGFYLPGDVLDPGRGLVDDGIGMLAITDVTVAAIGKMQLYWICRDVDGLADVFLRHAVQEKARLVERLVSLGRRSGRARAAHLFLELGVRLKRVGLASDSTYACPLNQSVLSDALGMSQIHLNRILRDLRQTGLLTFRDGIVRIDDLHALTELAEFDAGYLNALPVPDHPGP